MADGVVVAAIPSNDTSADIPDADASGGRTSAAAATATVKWPGWPGDNVFRLIVPVLKVGSIIGKKGELIKKMCDETRARIRVLDAPIGTPDRIVLISGKEDLGVELPPAMDAAIRVFKRVTDGDAEGADAAVAMFCSIRLLVSSSQAINLIGKQGSTIKSIQESSSATVRVLTEEECPSYANSEERIVEIHGESVRVLKALESILGHLRKFLVDHSVLPVFEKTYTAAAAGQDRKGELSSLASSTVAGSNVGLGLDYPSLSRDASFLDRDSSHFDSKYQRDGLSLFAKDPVLDYRSSGLGRPLKPIITQMTQTMQVPLSYAESIIGINGANIAYIRRTSGAILTVQESRGVPDEITVEVKGSSSQVQMAQNLIQEFISGHGPGQAEGVGGGMGNPKMEGGLGSLSRYSDPHYPSSAYASQLSTAYSASAQYSRYSSSAFRF